MPVCQTPFQGSQALVNGGGNSDRLKVKIVALVKFGYMLEHLDELSVGFS